MSDYYTLLTQLGAAALANAQALGQSVQLTELALGDGGGAAVTPTEADTALVHEVHRLGLSGLYPDETTPAWLIAEAVVPLDIGGWTIRELGLYTNTGLLFAVGNFPATYKPTLAEGAGRDLILRVIMEITSAASVTLQLDASVSLLTQAAADARYVNESGDSMRGPLLLDADPVDPLGAVPKQYVDRMAENIATNAANIAATGSAIADLSTLVYASL